MAPPTKMDAQQLTEEGHYGVFGRPVPAPEMPGCSLCMGNQAQVKEGATVMSTSTRNFPIVWARTPTSTWVRPNCRRLLPKLGRIPTKAEYLADMGVIKKAAIRSTST